MIVFLYYPKSLRLFIKTSPVGLVGELVVGIINALFIISFGIVGA